MTLTIKPLPFVLLLLALLLLSQRTKIVVAAQQTDTGWVDRQMNQMRDSIQQKVREAHGSKSTPTGRERNHVRSVAAEPSV